MKNKISLRELSAYFPYKVKAKFKERNDKKCKTYVVGTVSAIYDDCTIVCNDTVNSSPDEYKLLLKPCLNKDVLYLKVCDVNYLLEHHFDIFGLIEKGLAEELKEQLK